MKKLLIVCCIALLISCEKDKDVFLLNGTYYLPSQGTMNAAIRMFTVDGEVTDKTIINNFLNSKTMSFQDNVKISTIFFLNNLSVPINPESDFRITFEDDEAIINPDCGFLLVPNDTYNAEIVRLDSLIIVTAAVGAEHEYIEKPTNINDYFYTTEISKVKNIIYGYFHMNYEDGIVSFVGRYNFPFIIENNKISIPLLKYYYRKRTVNYKEGYVFTWNMANENYLKNLSGNDTVLIQEGKIVLRKR